MEILTSIAGTVIQYLVVPIGRELGNLFFYKTNIKDLEEQLRTLRDSRERVQSFVNVARCNAYEIHNDVLTWLEKVDSELLLIPQQNDEGGSNRNHSNLSCLNLVQCQPRKIKKMTTYILQLIDDGKKFDKNNVGRPAPLPSTKCSTLPTDYQSLESRTLMVEKIKDALADPNVNKVGVCGMGGVGKTKLLVEVKKLVLENNLFHRVINATVGTSKGVKEIQDEIVGMLNMNLNTNSTKEVRASHLQKNLVEMKENILIMLDDLWKEYDLEKEFGIPCRSKSSSKGCKILMTSRSQGVFTNQMNIERLFEINPLSDEEAWKFFMAIVGERVHHGDIEHIAREVVKECGGLPIALNTIAKSLKQKRVEVWKDALNKLKKHTLVGIPRDTCLKISYDLIEDDQAKLLFHLCSVFLGDQQIWMKDLQMYAMGMGLLNDVNDWKDARNRVIKLIDDLKSSHLLLKSEKGDNYVQMHGVARNVAKYIASKIDKMPSLSFGCGQSEWLEEHRYGFYNAIFVDCKDFPNLPSKLEFPNLQLLILRNKIWKSNVIQIPNAFFEGMENLRVLDMTNMSFEPSQTLLTSHSIKNLQTLCMSYCECSDIDTIGELKKLKILRIYQCGIQELPKTMRQLTELKMLEVSHCNLKVIHPNIISSMTKLEELNLWSSFQRWGEKVSYKNKSITNVKLSELDYLTHLSTLRLETLNVDILLNELNLERAQNLEEFSICVGHNRMQYRKFNINGYATTLELDIKTKAVFSGGVLEILLQRCEELHVTDSVGFTKALFNPNGNYGYSRLKHLDIYIDENSDMPLQIIGNITPVFDAQVSFPELKDLTIRNADYLETLWHSNRINANSFCKLQKIYITSCNKLTYLFPSHMVASLVFLNKLDVGNCKLIERIFEIEELTNDVKVVPLKKLSLYSLPNLKYVWNNDPGEFLIFPNLKDVRVENCPQLENLFPASFIKHMEEIELLITDLENEIFAEDEALKLVFPEIASFPSLKILVIKCKVVEKRSFWMRSESFPKLQRLELSSSEDDNIVSLPLEMSELLYRIQNFTINRACKLVQVFQNGEENNQRHAKLERLYLYDLPKLMHVWEENTQMISSFDSLEHIVASRCENLKCLLPSSLTFFNLTDIQVSECNGMMNLFSSSVAKRLVNLKSICIRYCEGMSSIVVAEGEEEEEEIIIFNRMNELRLLNLPRLVSFHTRKCTLGFPCLNYLVIMGCLEMKTFSYGIISTPRLPCMFTDELGDISVSPAQDINLIIQKLFTQHHQGERDSKE